MNRRGLYITIDGIDGAGKSTQCRLLKERLIPTACAGRPVLLVREPGDTAIGEEVRRLVLATETPLCQRAQAALYLAASAQLYHERIAPALEVGGIVISDRSHLSTAAYQSESLGDALELFTLARRLTGSNPDVWILLDVPVAECRRRKPPGPDRFERQPDSFMEALRERYLQVLSAAPLAPGVGFRTGWQGSTEEVAVNIWRFLQTFLKGPNDDR